MFGTGIGDGGFTVKLKSISRSALVLLLMLAPIAASNVAAKQKAHEAPVAAKAIPGGFVSATAQVNGTVIHYVAGGQGPAVILIHGFPENWSTYAKIMPRLASRFRVIAVDLRGIGGSASPEHGYDSATMAEDIHQLASTLGLDRPYVVGHDFGGWVAYALARLYPDTLRGAMIIDVPIPGLEPWDTVKVDPKLWNFGFHRVPGLAEKLLAGRETIYFGYYIRRSAGDPKSISDADIERYARAYAGPGQMAAAMEMYRAIDDDEKFARERRGPLNVPLTLVAGGNSFGALLTAMTKGLEDAGATSVATETVAGSGHYLLDEKPGETTALIERYASIASSDH
jgi:pimeloyl-ACP methyl ester carboxylesterase